MIHNKKGWRGQLVHKYKGWEIQNIAHDAGLSRPFFHIRKGDDVVDSALTLREAKQMIDKWDSINLNEYQSGEVIGGGLHWDWTRKP